MPQKLYILTTACPDTTGIVAAIAGFLAANNGLITEAHHHDDPYTRMSFMRTAFHDSGQGMPSLEALDRKFAEEVGRRFGMEWHFHEVERRCRALLAVSRQGHCLNSILHRWSTGTLPIEVVAVASNHQDMRSLAEWHGVPYYYLPIIEQEVERVDHTQSPEDLTIVGSELGTVVLNRAIKWHAERRVFRNGGRTVVLK